MMLASIVLMETGFSMIPRTHEPSQGAGHTRPLEAKMCGEGRVGGDQLPCVGSGLNSQALAMVLGRLSVTCECPSACIFVPSPPHPLHSRELGEVVGLQQAVKRFLPLASVYQLVELGDPEENGGGCGAEG